MSVKRSKKGYRRMRAIDNKNIIHMTMDLDLGINYITSYEGGELHEFYKTLKNIPIKDNYYDKKLCG
jgi:hypothetical protein